MAANYGLKKARAYLNQVPREQQFKVLSKGHAYKWSRNPVMESWSQL